MLKKIINKLKKKPIEINPFRELLLKHYKTKPATIVQIGACDGEINDPIYKIIRDEIKSTTVVLIEPQPDLIDILKRNYAYHMDARVENVAIGKQGRLVLYRLKKEFWNSLKRTYLEDAPIYRVPSGFVSHNYEHVLKHIEGKLPNDIAVERAIETLEVPSMELIDVIKPQGINNVDVLQIDVEGMDDIAIHNSNIDFYNPKIIHYEHMHLGVERNQKLHQFLIDLGYCVCEYSPSDTLATSLHID